MIVRRANRSRPICRWCLPLCRTMVKTLLARADSGFYCWDAVEAYESVRCGFIIVARKTARLVEE